MTEFIEVKTTGLAGEALNWAVSQAMGVNAEILRGGRYGEPESRWYVARAVSGERLNWVEDWALTGPLKVANLLESGFDGAEGGHWYFTCAVCGTDVFATSAHDQYLSGICRAVVELKLGEAVPIPIELVNP